MISESEASHKPWLDKPKLRVIEIIPVSDQGRQTICLRDPSRVAQRPLFLSPAAIPVLMLLNGENDLRDIQAEYMRQSGQLVDSDVLRKLIQTLDENLYLEGETFTGFLNRRRDEFNHATIRPALLAGQAYPVDPELLSRQLNDYYTHPRGPGRSDPPESTAGPRGLMAPHIDFQRGGPCYAWAYQQLDPEKAPALVVILGTAHSHTKHSLTICGKDFATPWGRVLCQKDLAEELSNRVGPSLTADEFVHLGEHSVEFQVICLRHRFKEAEQMRILPFLCGSFHHLLAENQTPEDDPEYETTLTTLKEALDQWSIQNGPVMILASVDLSHVGPQFGARDKVTPELAAGVKDYDLALLDLVTAGDHAGFFEHVARIRDITNVCGFSSIYTMLRLLDRPQGKLLAYDQWVDPGGQGLVSFASLAFL